MISVLDMTMAALFALATVVQLNDPDPLRWIAVYGAASLLSLGVALRRRVSPAVCAGVAMLALAWAAVIVVGGPPPAVYRSMFDGWEMDSAAVEEAREASGLILVAVWLIALSLRLHRRVRRAGAAERAVAVRRR